MTRAILWNVYVNALRSKSRQIGCDDVKSIGKPRDEVSEHMAGARKAMQQQQRLRVRRPCFAIENIEALDIGLPKADFVHDGPRAAAR